MAATTGKLRSMKCELSFLDKADGSCSFTQGRTTIWSSCSGPGDVHVTRRENEKMHLDVSVRNTTGESKHHELNDMLEAALMDTIHVKLFPRTCLSLTVQCIQSEGSTNAAILTAASLSVLDNGVPCEAPFCGVNIVKVNGELVLDPDSKMEAKAEASFLFALKMNSEGNGEMICSKSIGPFSYHEFASALSLAQLASTDIFTFFRETFQRKLSVDIFTRSDQI